MCSRFRVSLDFGRKLQPLVERALHADAEKRRLLLEMIERSFAQEARRLRLEHKAGGTEDWQTLTSVARVLHGWNPPRWFDPWADEPPVPPGFPRLQ